ncbi:MAG: GNAT family N-acetyltransferase [Proteobacteria bacterium]|nr:GNAT family N-acetyltransferase [Pseudomonadota bacterium]
MIKVIPMTSTYAHGWRQLWRMNVGDALPKPVIDHTERMILDPQSSLFALLARTDDNEIVGLLHGVVHPVAGSMNNICYMQDLYVHPARRRQGVATQLLNALSAKGRAEKWDRIYWLTEHSNTDAQKFYRGQAVSLDFSFHILPLGMLDKIGVTP